MADTTYRPLGGRNERLHASIDGRGIPERGVHGPARPQRVQAREGHRRAGEPCPGHPCGQEGTLYGHRASPRPLLRDQRRVFRRPAGEGLPGGREAGDQGEDRLPAHIQPEQGGRGRVPRRPAGTYSFMMSSVIWSTSSKSLTRKWV